MDLRVMSPTSYQTALPRDAYGLRFFPQKFFLWKFFLNRLISIAGYLLVVTLSLKLMLKNI